MRPIGVVCGVILGLALGQAARAAEAENALTSPEKSIAELPGDLWNVAFVWTEPLKHVAKETRHFDPISGAWFGLLEGSMKSVERTAGFFLPAGKDKEKDGPSPSYKSGDMLYKYSF